MNENGLDAADFNWSYDSESRAFTASEKIEGEASVDSEYDFIRPDFDWSGLEEAEDDEEVQEEIYTFVYITQNTKGKNGATTVKASSLEEAKAYFEEFAKENDLGELDWTYDEDTKTFTAREKVEENQTIEGETSVDSVYDFNRPEIDWSGAEEVYERELQATKEAAIAELQGIYIKDEELFGRIQDAERIEEVKKLRSDAIDARQALVGKLDDQEASADSEYDFVRPDVDLTGLDEGYAREQAAEALEAAKAEAIEELTADGVTSDLWFELINKANTIEGVESLKNDILNARERQRQEAVALEVGKTAAIADLEDLLRTSVTEDLTDDEKALINDARSLEEVDKVKAEIIDNRSEVYTLKFTQDGEEDYRNTKALHPGEAREVFLNFIQEEDLVVVVLHYDEETNTFTAVPDGGELEVSEEEGYDFLPNDVLEFEEIQDEANAQLLREAQTLQQAKEESYEQLNAAGITSKGLYERIANANSVEEVEQLTEGFLESRRQQLAQDLAVAKA